MLRFLIFTALFTFAALGAPDKPVPDHRKCSSLFGGVCGGKENNLEVILRKIRKHNSLVMDGLSDPLPPPQPGRLDALDATQAQAIYDEVKNHPVAGLAALETWDRYNYKGYCYGRAMAVHLEALLRHKVDQKHIRKIWAVGDEMQSGPNSRMATWKFHVATMVKAKGTEYWWVIDPEFEKPLPVADWHARMKGTRKDDQRVFFTSAANRVSAGENDFYDANLRKDERFSNGLDSSDPRYRQYFDELIKSYQTRDKQRTVGPVTEPQ